MPVENLIGEEGQGFQYIMFNFIGERFGLIVQVGRYVRKFEIAVLFVLSSVWFRRSLDYSSPQVFCSI